MGRAFHNLFGCRETSIWHTQGMASRNVKLTDDQVRQIRREYAAGLRGKAEAHRYGLSAVHWNAIGRGRAWAHIPMEPKNEEPKHAS